MSVVREVRHLSDVAFHIYTIRDHESNGSLQARNELLLATAE